MQILGCKKRAKDQKIGVRVLPSWPQCCEPEPGKGINPLPRDWEGRDLFKNLSDWLSTRPEAQGLGGLLLDQPALAGRQAGL